VEILFLISLIQEIWLAEPKGAHWNIRNPVHVPDGSMMKTRWYIWETTNARWWKRDVTIVKTRYYDCANTMVRWWNCDDMMIKTRYYFYHCVIASSWFHHRAIVVLPSCHRVFIIVSLRFHSCTILHRGSGRQKCYLYRNQAIFERYNIVTCFASRRNLASRFASRTSTPYTSK
jgi:hypothetical protein